MSDIIKAKQEKRFRVLNRVYELTDGDANSSIDSNQLAQEIQLDDNEVDLLIDYLVNEGLLERPFIGSYIAITHVGVKEVEDFLRNPQRGTQHFQHAQVTNNFYAPVGVAQTGVNTATVHMGQSDNMEMVLALLTQLKSMKSQVSSEHQEEFEAELEDVEAEVKNPEKKANKMSKVIRALNSAKTLAGSTVGIIEVIDKLKDAVTNLLQ